MSFLALGGMSAGTTMNNQIALSEPNRGWAGFVGNSKTCRKKHTNLLHCSHKAKLKRRKAK